jgi:uncharacterized protein (TIGR02186 family)
MRASIVFKTIALLALTSLIGMAAFAPAAMAELAANVNNDLIEINLNYNGSTLSIDGDADAGSDVIIKITGAEKEEKLKSKDKIGGLLWMNTDEHTFTAVPDLYFLRSTADPEQILNPEQLVANGIGYIALAHTGRIEPEPSPDQRVVLFDQFFKYKEDQDLYKQSFEGIETGSAGGSQHFETVFDWPYQAKPGTYEVTVFTVKDGQITATSTGEVRVEEVGVVKTLSDMSKNNGGLYGLLAIGVAVIAGFGVGVVFRKGGGAH